MQDRGEDDKGIIQVQFRTESSLPNDEECDSFPKPQLKILQSQLSLCDEELANKMDGMSLCSPSDIHKIRYSQSWKLEPIKMESNPNSPLRENKSQKNGMNSGMSLEGNQQAIDQTKIDSTGEDKQTKEIEIRIQEEESLIQTRPKRKVSKAIYNVNQISSKQVDDSPDIIVPHKPCQCQKSHCLQLYCSCFHNKLSCSKECSCKECLNDGQHEDDVLRAIEQIKAKEQRASHNDLDSFDTRTIWGCKCKKTHCMNGYCECYIRDRKCTSHCQCKDCHNRRPNIQKKIEKIKHKSKNK